MNVEVGPVQGGRLSGRDEELRLGGRLRTLRTQLGVTLSEVAARAQISIGQLSEIERGISAPSLRSLRLISEALGVPVGRLFDGDCESVADERFILRRAARPVLRLTATGVIKTLLSPAASGTLDLYEISILPGGTSGGEFQTGPGEKAGIVTVGRLRLWLDHRPADLATGDSFQFPADIPHSLENPFDVPTVVLWAVSPTSIAEPRADAAPGRRKAKGAGLGSRAMPSEVDPAHTKVKRPKQR